MCWISKAPGTQIPRQECLNGESHLLLPEVLKFMHHTGWMDEEHPSGQDFGIIGK